MKTAKTVRHLALLAGIAMPMAAQAQLSIIQDTGTFIDISRTGTDIGVHADDATGTFSAAFGNCVLPAGIINISSNGIITVPANPGFTNQALTASSGAGYYPFWDDLRTDNAGPPAGTIYAENLVDRTIIQWNNIGTFAGGAGTGTFQVQIFGNTSGLQALYFYTDTDFGGAPGSNFGASATIGAVAPTGFSQFSMNTPNAVNNQTILGVYCVPAPGAAALLGLGGVLAVRRRRA